MILLFSQAALDARFVGGLQAFLDGGAGPARVALFESSTPGVGPVVAELVLAKPSGFMDGGQYMLVQGDAEGDLIQRSGTPQSGRMFNGSGARVCDGDVSDAAGDGVFKIDVEGGGAQLYAGGRVRLVDSYFF